MLGDVDDIRRALVARVSAAFASELEEHDPAATLPWELWSNVHALVDHLGRNYLWAAGIVRTGEQVDRKTLSRAPRENTRPWFEECRAELLAAFDETPADQPCWVIGGGIGETRFWRRRMVYESVKHLMDLRASGNGAWQAAPEIAAVDYADGLDELFEVFLALSRASLAPLPSPLRLSATDVSRSWNFAVDWTLSDTLDDTATTVHAAARDLALLAWERADPFDTSGRFAIDGSAETVAAFAAAPIHP